MEINLITKVIDKVHDGEMSKEQGFNRIEQIMINYYKELDEAYYDKGDIRREIFYLFDFRNGILAGQVEGDENKIDEDIKKLCSQIDTDYETMEQEWEDTNHGREPNLQDD